METCCRPKRLLITKVSDGEGCRWKSLPTAEGNLLLLEDFSNGNLHGLETVPPYIAKKKIW